MVGAGGTQIEHRLCIVLVPPGTGELEPLLNHITMRAFDLTGADGQVGCEGFTILEPIFLSCLM